MPHVTLPISASGPVVDLVIGVSLPRARALRAAKQPIPSPVKIQGLIDTGASGTCVDPACIARLGLVPTGQAIIHTPSTGDRPHPCAQYDVSIVLLHPGVTLTIPVVPVIEAALSRTQGFQALIGRDVLARCLFVYDGASETFSLAF